MAEHQERNRIAQILHDDLQQLLYSIQIKLLFLRDNAETGDRAKLLATAEEARQWLAEGVTTVQRLALDLSPQVLEGEGLTDALRWLARQMKELHGLEIDVVAAERFPMPRPQRVMLFQSVRELLFNIVKHAEVQNAVVEMSRDGSEMLIRVSDQGEGFDVASLADHDGFGVLSVRHRLSLFGGSMEIDSQPRQGTRTLIRVPLDGTGVASPQADMVT
jgi:signal transduction histidine kinase